MSHMLGISLLFIAVTKNSDVECIFVIRLVHKESSLKVQGRYTAEYCDAVFINPASYYGGPQFKSRHLTTVRVTQH